ncbi:hypothetical protein M427DRAFT_31947 [Gonapodya prolifera JEL478]|uniref:Uncharacterized protein n=1 Tax=Gonapodya prolifera (strain JEL478) TaxID=1344416 RepID=A0A139AHX0_GONPJ|nr:hypothetical protein M427DRAFT_31947 [Gonapodya prolifera JEL478]|eukprot:KXS16025.1 hypothetical protein M427DRAFT_31947 [Gonapodya prolifera JEL478]
MLVADKALEGAPEGMVVEIMAVVEETLEGMPEEVGMVDVALAVVEETLEGVAEAGATAGVVLAVVVETLFGVPEAGPTAGEVMAVARESLKGAPEAGATAEAGGIGMSSDDKCVGTTMEENSVQRSRVPHHQCAGGNALQQSAASKEGRDQLCGYQMGKPTRIDEKSTYFHSLSRHRISHSFSPDNSSMRKQRRYRPLTRAHVLSPSTRFTGSRTQAAL